MGNCRPLKSKTGFSGPFAAAATGRGIIGTAGGSDTVWSGIPGPRTASSLFVGAAAISALDKVYKGISQSLFPGSTILFIFCRGACSSFLESVTMGSSLPKNLRLASRFVRFPPLNHRPSGRARLGAGGGVAGSCTVCKGKAGGGGTVL
jgi:hypothetical protein